MKGLVRANYFRRACGRLLSLAILIPLSGCTAVRAPRQKPINLAPPAPAAEMDKIKALAGRWEREPIPVGLTRHVFYDDALVRFRETNIVRRVGRAEKYNNGIPVLVADQAWELAEGPASGVGVYFSVLTNASGRFQMWYSSGRVGNIGSYYDLGYAESTNGINWRKPLLLPSLCNIVMSPCFSAGVYRDPHASGWSGQRYKMVYGTVGLTGVGANRGLAFAYSSSGSKWSMYPDVRMLDDCWSDTQSNLFWDDELRMYRLYTRIWFNDERGRSSRQFLRSHVGTSRLAFLAEMFFIPSGESPWMHVEDASLSTPGKAIYAMNVHPANGMYIAYVTLHQVSIGEVDFCLALSRSGCGWDFSWVDQQYALVTRGPSGSVDYGMIFPPSTPPLTVGDEWYIYYSGCRIRHDDTLAMCKPDETIWSVSLAKLRMEGFFYLENTGAAGMVETKSFILEGADLEINADASAQSAELILAIMDDQGGAIAGFTAADAVPIKANGCHLRPAWRERSLAELQGRLIRLQFILKGAVRLYAFQVLE